MTGREELDEDLSCIEGVDVADALQIIQRQILTAVANKYRRQMIIKYIKMADWEPDEVRAEVFNVIELSQDHIVSGVHQLDLDNDGLHAKVLQSDQEGQRCFLLLRMRWFSSMLATVLWLRS